MMHVPNQEDALNGSGGKGGKGSKEPKEEPQGPPPEIGIIYRYSQRHYMDPAM
jgi:hypothetical protein